MDYEDSAKQVCIKPFCVKQKKGHLNSVPINNRTNFDCY